MRIILTAALFTIQFKMKFQTTLLKLFASSFDRRFEFTIEQIREKKREKI